ncbi:MAG: hypothetical protein K2X37_02950, partial [Chitinophagaceae bacterium]|nr:hypothetical protein [Chitinophagaceae bacterium]
PLSTSYAVEPWASKTTRENRPAALGWTIASPNWNTIDGSVYTACLSVLGNSCIIRPDTPLDSIDVSIGNTPGEALSAYLAGSTNQNTLGLTPESILNAAQAGVLGQALEPDGPAVIENALHSQAFQSEFGGWLWCITTPPPKQAGLSSSPENNNISFTDALAEALNTLNSAQVHFDRIQREQQAQRHFLFTDWCRAVHLGTDVSGPAIFPNGTTTSNTGVQLDVIAANALNASAAAVNTASVGKQEILPMLVYHASKKLYLAYVEVVNQLAILPGTDNYCLKRQPAPRFWRPTDPVVMMSDNNGGFLQATPANSLPDTLIQNRSYLTLATYPPGDASPLFLPTNWNANNAVPSDNYIAGVMAKITALPCKQSWRPLFLYWDAHYYPFPGTGCITSATSKKGPFMVTAYKEDFITSNFLPDPTGIELIPKTGVNPISTTFNAYQGRVTLSPHITKTMRERILLLTGQVSSPPATSSGLTLPGLLGQGETKKLIDAAYDSTVVTLSQALNGFHDRLLMLNRIAQINIFDTNYTQATWNENARPWDSCSQSFYNEIGRQSRTSPNQNDAYNPIRAGKCELTS